MGANPDFKDLFSVLSSAHVDFIVVGAHAVMLYTEPRFTKVLDIWIRPSQENAARVLTALTEFGAPMADLTMNDLASPGTIFQIGVEPNRVDIMTSIDAVTFDEAWSGKKSSSYDGVPIFVLGIDQLRRNKQAAGRPQDLLG